MLNSMQELMPKILSRALVHFRYRAIMPRIVNSNFDHEIVKKGTQVCIPFSEEGIVDDVAITPVNILMEPTDVAVPSQVVVSLDQWRQTMPVGITDKERQEILDNDSFLPLQIRESLNGLSNSMNQFVYGKYAGVISGVYNFISNPSDGSGTIINPFGPGTTDTSGVSAAESTQGILNRFKCSREDRRGVLNFDAESALLDLGLVSTREKIGATDAAIYYEMGKAFGVNWFADDHLPTHTAGTSYKARPGNVTLKEAERAGSDAISILDADAGTLVAGDIITVEGDDQTYCVTGSNAPYTLHASRGVQVSIAPTLQVSQEGGGQVIAVANSHQNNIVFHKDAFAFAMQVADAGDVGREMITGTDPASGITLRLEVKCEHYQTVFTFDILYGAALAKPEYCVRVAGAV